MARGNQYRQLIDRLVLTSASALFLLGTYLLRESYTNIVTSLQTLADSVVEIKIQMAAAHERDTALAAQFTALQASEHKWSDALSKDIQELEKKVDLVPRRSQER